MPNYRRPDLTGGTFFITQVTYQRYPWLCKDLGRLGLREAIEYVREKYPLKIDAFVLLPDHFHCLWTLPPGDSNFSLRMRLIKRFVTKHYKSKFDIKLKLSASRQKREEGNLWQRRFWEHCIRDQEDFEKHCDYIHYNPVKHGLCDSPKDWKFSSFSRFVV